MACRTARVVLAEKALRFELAPEANSPGLPRWLTEKNQPVEGLEAVLLFLEKAHPSPALLDLKNEEMAFRECLNDFAFPLYRATEELSCAAMGRAVDERDLPPLTQATQNVYSALDRLEDRLSRGPWLLGEGFSLLDLLFTAPLLTLEELDVPISPTRPVLHEWAMALLERPSAQA